MQLNLATFLIGAAPAAPAATSGQSSGGEEGHSNFAQLLGDAAGGNADQGSNKGALPGNDATAAAALIAQELDPAQLALLQGVQGDKLAELLTQSIGPEQATALLAKIAQMQNAGGGHGGGDPAFDQLKEALQNIEQGGEPKKVAELLDTLPAVANANSGERAPMLQRLLGWMQAAMEKPKNQEASSQTDAMPDGTAQSLQASLFPAGADAAQAAAAQAAAKAAADEKRAQESAAVVIVPLAYNSSASMPEWVKKLGQGDSDVASDDIPSLALRDVDKGLPAVNLPAAKAVAADAMAKAVPHGFHDLLQNAAANDNDQPDHAQPVTINAQGALAAPGTIASHSNVTPLTLSAHTHLAPHVAAAEQVQVAITSATKDGVDKITLQLEPAELGRVEIKMEMKEGGHTQLTFLVDKPDTLASLSRDARSLERSLQEAGIKSDAGSMQFNLRQQPQPAFSDTNGQGQRSAQQQADSDEENEKSAAAAAALGGITQHYTINVRDGVDLHA